MIKKILICVYIAMVFFVVGFWMGQKRAENEYYLEGGSVIEADIVDISGMLDVNVTDWWYEPNDGNELD